MGNLGAAKPQELRRKFNLDVLCETGTEAGEGVATALRAGFNKIYSIELNAKWAEKAADRFKNNKKVVLEFGSSIQFLKGLYQLDGFENCKKLFWLDAHLPKLEIGMKDIVFPLKSELTYLMQKESIKKDVIIIDDAGLFEKSLRPDNWDEILKRYTKVDQCDLTTEDIYSYFPTHDSVLLDQGEGMLILTPKG